MTPQSTFMIVAPILDGRRAALEAVLETMNERPGHADPMNALIPFGQFEALHSARLLVLESPEPDELRAYGETPRPLPPSLALHGEIDGDRERFLAELAVRATSGLTRIFSHCEGFDARRGTLLEWLEAHSVRPAATYVSRPGRTVRQVREDATLHRALAEALPAIVDEVGAGDVREIRQRLLTHVQYAQHAGRLELTPPAPTPWGYRLRRLADKVTVPIVALALSPLLLVAAPYLLWRLRRIERDGPEIPGRATPEHVSRLARVEDRDVTNPFSVMGEVKPGRFPSLLARTLVRLIDYFASHVYTKGSIGRIRTIHAARWVWLNDRRSMYFASVYDGSLESYMDDFINKVSFGLNLSFGMGAGYPRTRWLIKGGAERELPFKDTLRRHQLPTAVWYRANRGLTAVDMERNARLREGVLSYPGTDAAVRRWLNDI